MRGNILLAVGAAVVVAGGFAVMVRSSRDTAPPLVKTPLNASIPGGAAPGTDQADVVPSKPLKRFELPYYVIHDTGQDQKLSPRSTAVLSTARPSEWRQAHIALTAMEKPSNTSTEYYSPIPDGAKILGVNILNGLATVNLSSNFRENFNGGAREEQMTIYAIVNTVGHIPGVQGVKFEIAGHPIDEFAGHLDLSEPLVPDDSLVESAP